MDGAATALPFDAVDDRRKADLLRAVVDPLQREMVVGSTANHRKLVPHDTHEANAPRNFRFASLPERVTGRLPRTTAYWYTWGAFERFPKCRSAGGRRWSRHVRRMSQCAQIGQWGAILATSGVTTG